MWGQIAVCSHWLICSHLSFSFSSVSTLFSQIISLPWSKAPHWKMVRVLQILNHSHGPTWPGHSALSSLPFSQKAKLKKCLQARSLLGEVIPEKQSKGTRDSKMEKHDQGRIMKVVFLCGQWQLHPARLLWGHRSSVPVCDGGRFIHQQSQPISHGLLQGVIPWHFVVCSGANRAKKDLQVSSNQVALGAQWYRPYLLSWSSNGQSYKGTRPRRCKYSWHSHPATHTTLLWGPFCYFPFLWQSFTKPGTICLKAYLL